MLWYRNHKNAEKVFGWPIWKLPQCETFMDFKMWSALYHADKANWHIEMDEDGWWPYYLENGVDSDNTFHCIKFVNAREYRKFKRFVRRLNRTKDDYENVQEQTHLCEVIRQKATERAAEAQEAVMQAARDSATTWQEAVYNTQNAKLPTGRIMLDSQGRAWVEQ